MRKDILRFKAEIKVAGSVAQTIKEESLTDPERAQRQRANIIQTFTEAGLLYGAGHLQLLWSDYFPINIQEI